MIKKIITLSCLVALSGCYSVRNSATQHHISTEKLKESTKVGKACATGFFAGPFGDYTIETARKDGNITEINSVENDVSWVLGVNRICTIVRGN